MHRQITHARQVSQKLGWTKLLGVRKSFASLLALSGVMLSACPADTILTQGEFGKPIDLATGDEQTLPRLAFRLESCPGTQGGCSSICTNPPEQCPTDACLPILIDSTSSITVLHSRDNNNATTVENGCLELRSADRLLQSGGPSDIDLKLAVTRFRVDQVPILRSSPQAMDLPFDWSWQVGNQDHSTYVGGILGGNVLSQLAIRFFHYQNPLLAESEDGVYQVTFYRTFPGSEEALADRGRVFLPLQFPGRLLGKNDDDVCLVDEQNCDFAGLTNLGSNRLPSALQPSRMVLDACLAPPPATVSYDAENRACRLSPGPEFPKSAYISPTGRITHSDAALSCQLGNTPPSADVFTGKSASLLVATGIPNMVLFADSAQRFFGPLEELPLCSTVGDSQAPLDQTPACREQDLGFLHLPGWPTQADPNQPTLLQLRVRSVGLVPGSPQTSGIPPCLYLETRLHGLLAQCNAALATGIPQPSSSSRCIDAVKGNAVVLGEVYIPEQSFDVNPEHWLKTTILPADHPMVINLRRDTSPDALQLDGLLGTVLFDDTDVVLDYTDVNPGLRFRCLKPDSGACEALTTCEEIAEDDMEGIAARCCHGLPENLLLELIQQGVSNCCAAISEIARMELNEQAENEGRDPPCPTSNLF